MARFTSLALLLAAAAAKLAAAQSANPGLGTNPDAMGILILPTA